MMGLNLQPVLVDVVQDEQVKEIRIQSFIDANI
jgi:hypothetical protein